MNNATIPILAALSIQLALGLTVFYANRHRKSNQCFLLLSFVAAGWLGTLYFALTAANSNAAALWIRETSAFGALNLFTFNLLRLSIREHQRSWSAIFSRSRAWLVVTIGMVAFCQTHFFLQGAYVAATPNLRPPEPIYGSGVYVYALYFATGIITLVVACLRDLRKASMGVRAELGFVMIGGVSTLGLSLLLTFILDIFIEPSRRIWFAPSRVILFSGIVAYGIATQKLMDVGTFLRRVTAYSLLAAYLLSLYVLVWWLARTVLQELAVTHGNEIAHVAAAMVIAFAMAPARGLSQQLAERLFIGSHRLDFRATVSKAAKVLSSVTTLQDLLDKFANTVGEAVGTDRIFILLGSKQGFTQHYPQVLPGSRQRLELTHDQATIEQLDSTKEPIVMDELHRLRPTSQIQRVIRQLDSLQIALAMGIFSRDHLAGVLLLGARKSGRIYGSVEQNALQVLCGQLAVAIENAELFTEVQNAKIYNETLLENLTSAVIAAGVDERITVFNNEAGQITSFSSEEMLDRSINDLPETIREPLRKTLETGKSQDNGEIVLGDGTDNCVVRASTSIFHGQDQEILGAMMVLTDITALKQLELQIRRSDRLASLGTLSAGMAHEIKNPLVSIKTFAQLLPERYLDSDFRETFSNLIGHEIDRIDSLVNQLLRFARPAKPLLNPLHVHEALEKALLLVGHRLYQKEIKLTRSWEANVDTIRADANQLEQVFLNFFLNAMDAMKKGGELIVMTSNR